MSQDPTLEDQTILAAIEGLERDADPSAAPPPFGEGSEAAETLARLYTEVLGLIPAELPPAVPSPELKDRLMRAVTGGATVGAAAAPAPRAVPQTAAPAPFALPSAPPAARLPDPFPAVDPFPVQPVSGARRQPPRPQSLAATRRPVGWPGALAAGLILALAGLSGWLWLQQADQRARLAGLETELQEERQKAALASQQAEQFRREFTDLRTGLTLVTAPAALVAPLRPVGAPALQPDARGALFVAPDHQHWHLSIEGLRPAADDKTYQLWFIPDQGPPVTGGTFVAKLNERMEMSSEAMPPGTKSAMVTLEAAPGVLAPSGPEVLRAAGMIQIL